MKLGNVGEPLSPEKKQDTERITSEMMGKPVEITEQGDNFKGLMNDTLEFGSRAIDSFSETGTAEDSFGAGLDFGSQIFKRIGDSIETSSHTIIVD